MTSETKTCVECLQVKALGDFKKAISRSTGRPIYCAKCKACMKRLHAPKGVPPDVDMYKLKLPRKYQRAAINKLEQGNLVQMFAKALTEKLLIDLTSARFMTASRLVSELRRLEKWPASEIQPLVNCEVKL